MMYYQCLDTWKVFAVVNMPLHINADVFKVYKHTFFINAVFIFSTNISVSKAGTLQRALGEIEAAILLH